MPWRKQCLMNVRLNSALLRRFLVLLPVALLGHPMGNFSVSHYSAIEVGAQHSKLTYILDFAEIPTFQLFQAWQIDGRDKAILTQKASAAAVGWLANLDVTDGGQRVGPILKSVDVSVQDGAGGMPVLRVKMTALLPLNAGKVAYEDRNFPDRTGWKQVIVRQGQGAKIVSSTRNDADVTNGLTKYPADPTIAPPQELTAELQWTAAGSAAPKDVELTQAPQKASPAVLPIVPKSTHELPGAVSNVNPSISAQALPAAQPAFSLVQPKGAGTVVRGDYLSRMLKTQSITGWMILLGLGAAFGLGAVHALSPGHGKTIVAAYLVGNRGTAGHAVLLGATVTFTHTASVFLLGLGVLFFEKYIVPDRIIPWLGAVSGFSIVAVGFWLLYQRSKSLLVAKGEHAHHHDHHHGHEPHSHDHSHHTHDHSHDHGHHPEHVHAHSHDHHHHHGDEQDHVHHHDHLQAHDHSHTHGHTHHHDDSLGLHVHSHGGKAHTHAPPEKITLPSLIALGVSGGLVPCPSALVLMLSAIALGRAGLGLMLLVFFSLGLAVVLMGIGLMVIYAKNLLPERSRVSDHPFFRLMPIFSSVVVVCLGLGMVAVSLGWLSPTRFSL
ncbi:MAG: sulfite exporter TauE/SafE family protein [Bryobacteraceae bacterium]